MATEAIQPNPAARTHPIPRLVNRSVERCFFAGMAVLLAILVFMGFSPTYFRAGVVLAPLPNALVHIHGAVFSLWMVLFLVQTFLISAKRVAWHRSLGAIGFLLPPVMAILGIITAIDGLRRGVRIGPLDPATSLAFPLVGITVMFIPIIIAAWRTRRRPDSHKRYIIITTIGLSEAAMGRIPWQKISIATPLGLVACTGLLLLLLVAYDLFSLRRVHRSTLWAAPLTFAIAALTIPIGMTPPWHAFANFLSRTIAPYV